MDLINNNEDWGKEAPQLMSADKTNPFTVPEDYFSRMQDQLQSRILLEKLRPDQTEGSFSIPENYFETLEERIVYAVKAEELKNDAAADGFSVPGNYFTDLHHSILRKTRVQDEKKVRRLMPSWLSYAAAACITAVICTSIFFNLQNNTLDSKFSKLPEDAIISYLQTYSDTGDLPVIVENLDAGTVTNNTSGLTEKEIEQYLESTL